MNLSPATKPLSMLTLERAAPLCCTQKAISGPFTAPGSILLHGKRTRSLKGGKRASAISFSMKQSKQKIFYSPPSLEVCHIAWTYVHDIQIKIKIHASNLKTCMSLSQIHGLIFGTVRSGKCHNYTEATRLDSSAIATLIVENTAPIISDTEHTHSQTKAQANATIS